MRPETNSEMPDQDPMAPHGRSVCESIGIDPGPVVRASLEHQYWAMKVKEHFDNQGYETSLEHQVPGDGIIDLLAHRPGERVAVEVETGKSDIKENLAKLRNAGFDRIVFVATSPAAVGACRRVIQVAVTDKNSSAELLTWLDVS